MVLELGFVG